MSDRETSKSIHMLNRKLHIYAGLFLLLFILLFSGTGLILNHPQWKFAQFWPQRETATSERTITWPAETDSLERAQNLMTQLGIAGEIEGITLAPDDQHLDIRVVRPGAIIDIKTDRATQRAQIDQIRVNAWGVMNMLHSFTGVRLNEPAKQRDWIVTSLWSLSMDVLSVGLIVLSLGGLYMWFGTRRRRGLEWVALLAGVICCAVFVLGRLP